MGYRYHNGERWVGGTAAILHTIKQDGGLNQHYQRVIAHSIDVMIENTNRSYVRENLKAL